MTAILNVDLKPSLSQEFRARVLDLMARVEPIARANAARAENLFVIEVTRLDEIRRGRLSTACPDLEERRVIVFRDKSILVLDEHYSRYWEGLIAKACDLRFAPSMTVGQFRQQHARPQQRRAA